MSHYSYYVNLGTTKHTYVPYFHMLAVRGETIASPPPPGQCEDACGGGGILRIRWHRGTMR